ncbi:hypothetical protein ACWCQ0_50235 [Streptomyces massasporeus]
MVPGPPGVVGGGGAGASAPGVAAARKALTAAVDMLPEPRPDEEPVEIFDQLGPLPSGFGPQGPTGPAGAAAPASPTGPVGEAATAARGASTSAPSAAPAAPAVAPGAVPMPAATPVPPQQPQQPPQPHYQPQHPASPATAPLAAPAAAPAPLPGPSETGSFHLPPPVGHPTPSFDRAPTSAVPYGQAPTHPYTARPVQVPAQYAAPVGAATAPSAPAPVRRPGPPPKVAIPVLLLALVCFAVGFWALAQT